MLRDLSVALCVLLLAALVAVGCGSDSGGEAASEEPSPTVTAASDTTTTTAAPTATTTEPTPTPTAVPVAWAHYGDVEISDNARVVSIDANPDGTTWALIATDLDEGRVAYEVSRFEGDRWVPFEGLELAEERPFIGFGGYPDPRLAAGIDGTAWILDAGDPLDVEGSQALESNLWMFDGVEWSRIESPPTAAYVGIDVGGDGKLWVGTDFPSTQVRSYDGEEWADHPSHFREYHLLHADTDGKPWLFSSSGLYGLEDDEWALYPWSAGDLDEAGWFVAGQASVVAHDGTMWTILTSGTGISDAEFRTEIFDGESWGLWPADTDAEGWAQATATARRQPQLLAALGEEHLFVSTDMRLVWFDVSGVAQVITVDDGAAVGPITAVTSDPEGTIWIGKGGGLTRFNPTFYEPSA